MTVVREPGFFASNPSLMVSAPNRRMLPLLRLLEYAGKTQKILKHALDRKGMVGGASSSPKLPLGEEDKSLVDRLVREFEQV